MKRGYGVSWFICWALVGHVGAMLGFSRHTLDNLEDVHGPLFANFVAGETPQQQQVVVEVLLRQALGPCWPCPRGQNVA